MGEHWGGDVCCEQSTLMEGPHSTRIPFMYGHSLLKKYYRLSEVLLKSYESWGSVYTPELVIHFHLSPSTVGGIVVPVHQQLFEWPGPP